MGARGGVLLVFLSLPSIVVSPNGLNKYTRGHRTQGTAFHLAFKRMTKAGLVKWREMDDPSLSFGGYMADKPNQPQRKLLLVGLDFQVDIINQKSKGHEAC